ncbi:hypothetical protein [Aporhodopirellula aestuarii]|uniref:Uncharacterized protein n=1 Tax=Aporhodopirellula aestuarii TaxID=2950107 RepID=A0ABT0UAG9_9BACT|nr:hypothetical protein [Aporhodopirellula aestuarii]MCM2373859.1 hypothetical protein [Aporhodopirellula aestuarii]
MDALASLAKERESVRNQQELTTDREFQSSIASIDQFQNRWRLLFTPKFSDKIRRYLRDRSVNLNDWSLAVTMHVLAQCTSASAAPRRHIMLMNPVETRTWAQRRCTENHIGIAFLRRTHADVNDFEQTLESISEQMRNVRKYGTASETEVGLSIAERIPGCLKLLERLGTFTPTAALTCLASFRLGNRFGVKRRNSGLWIADAELADIFFEAPIQAGAELSTAILEFDGRLAVSLRMSPGALSLNTPGRVLALWSQFAEDVLSRGPRCK